MSMIDYNKLRLGQSMKWAEQRQPEIDSIRNTGEYNPSVWQKLKDGGMRVMREGLLDGAEFFDSHSLEGARIKDPQWDEKREQMYEAEKAQALKDFKTHQINPTSAWEVLRRQGQR